MTVIATENYRLSNLVKHEYEPSLAFCREAVVANDAAQDYVIGTVLGKVTATGKYVVSEEDAVDGSEVPAAVVLEDKAIPATTDTNVLAYVRGPMIVSKDALVLAASYDDDAKKAAAYASLEALGILVNDTI